MDFRKIISEILKNDTYLNLSSHAQFENAKFITESWEDDKGKIHYKTYHKDLKYTMHSKDGKFHNIHGPAIIKANGELEWWYEDQKVACVFKHGDDYKFSDLTPIDEKMIHGRIPSLELISILRARESHDKKLTVEEIQSRDNRIKPHNIQDILEKMRKKEESNSVSF